MDLDKLKETWKKTDVKPETDESKIYKILSRKGNTSLRKLIIYEKFGMLVCPFLIFLPFVHNYLVPTVSYPICTLVLFTGFCIIAYFWQIYKILLLKKLNISRIDIISSSKLITKYKKCLQYELFGGLCWIIALVGSYSFSLTYRFSTNNITLFIVSCSVLILLSVTIIILFYNFFYIKHIGKIQDAINEIKEFENQDD